MVNEYFTDDIMESLGFQDPDLRCSSEYVAIYEVIANVIDQYGPSEWRGVAAAIAEEFETEANAIVRRMTSCCTQLERGQRG